MTFHKKPGFFRRKYFSPGYRNPPSLELKVVISLFIYFSLFPSFFIFFLCTLLLIPDGDDDDDDGEIFVGCFEKKCLLAIIAYIMSG